MDYATYTTLSAIVTQINALGKGWVSSIYHSDLNNEVSTQLLPGSVMCGSQRNTTASDETLKIPDDIISIERFEGKTARLYRSAGFAQGFQNYAVSYTGGYTSTTMPKDLIEAVCEAAMALFTRGNEEGFGAASFSQSELTVKYMNWLPESTMMALDRYRRKVII